MKKKLKRLLALSLAIILVMSLFVGSNVFAAGSGDIKAFVEDVQVRNSSGTGGHISNPVDGTTYQISIRFVEGTKGQFVGNDAGELKYTLPEEVKLTKNIPNTPILVNGEPVGTYSANMSTGEFTIKFNSDVDTHDDQTKPIFNIYTDTIFTLVMEAKFEAGEDYGSIPVDFGDNWTLIFQNPKPTPKEPKLTLKKTATDVQGDVITYTVTITAEGEAGTTITGITLNDKPFTRVSGNTKTNLTAEQVAAYGSFSYKKNGSGSGTGITPTWENNSFNFDFGGVTLTPGETIVLTYKLDVNKLLEGNGTAFSDAYYVGNDALANGMNEGKNLTSNQASTISKTLVRVTRVEKNVSNSNTWTASVGNGTAPINGGTITDTQSSNNSEYPIAFPDPSKISVQFFTSPRGATANYTITAEKLMEYITFSGDGNNTLTFKIPDANVTRPGGGTFGTIYRVQLVYTTDVPNLPAVDTPSEVKSVTYTNNISFNGSNPITVTNKFSSKVNGGTTGPGTGGGTTTDTVPASALTITKASSGPKRTSTGYEIEYTITVKVAAGNDGKVFFLYDALSSGNSAITNSPTITDVTIDPNDSEGFKYNYIRSPSAGIQYWAITFGDGKVGASSPAELARSTWMYADERTITITYTLELDTAKITALKSTSGMTNTIVAARPDTGVIKQASVTDYWPINKSVAVDKDDATRFNYTVTLNRGASSGGFGGGNRRKVLFNSSDDAMFTDEFDSELEYVSDSFYVTIGNNSTRYLPDNDNDIVTGNKLEVNLAELKSSSGSAPNLYSDSLQINIYYSLEIKDPTALNTAAATHKFANIATIVATELGGSKFSADAEATYTDKSVSKTMPAPSGSTTTGGGYGRPSTTSGSSIAKATIYINSDGLQYGDGSTPLTVTDTMSASLRAYRGSMKIYELEGNNWVEANMNSGFWQIEYVSDTVIEFTVPDATPIKIEYDVLIITPVGQTADHSNSISIDGRAYTSTATLNRYMVNSSSASASYSISKFTLTKTDESTGYLLSDAKFKLYIAADGNGHVDRYNESDYITFGGSKFYALQELSTDSSGTATFDSSWLTPSHDAVYLLVETDFPSGYEVLSGTDSYTVFVLRAGGTFIDAFIEASKITPRIIADDISITNRPEETSGEKRYDLALKKWVSAVKHDDDSVGYSEPADGESVNPAPVRIGDKVTFRIRVINQGNQITQLTEVVDYLPAGYDFDPAANKDITLSDGTKGSWDWNDESAKDYLVFTPETPIKLTTAGTYRTISIPLIVTVNDDAANDDGSGTPGNLDNYAEISGMTDEGGGDVTDIDSTPDAVDNNDGGVKDNVVNEDGKNSSGDEDDHDVAKVVLIDDEDEVDIDEPTEYVINVKKTITGTDAAANVPAGGFRITIQKVGDNNATFDNSQIFFTAEKLASGTADDSFTIGDLMPGTYYFQVTENQDYSKGWTNDSTAYYIMLKVEYDDTAASGEEWTITESRKTVSTDDYTLMHKEFSGSVAAVEFNNAYDEKNVLSYDAALQKWIVSVGNTIIGDGADGPNEIRPIVATGDKVKFAIRVINQCDEFLIITDVSDYIPRGFEFHEDDAAANTGWIVDGTRLSYTTPIRLNAGESETIFLTLTVRASGSLYNTAEISEMTDGDHKVVEDRDSDPDTDPNNDKLPTDNVVDNRNDDEDDHDFAEVRRPTIPGGPDPSETPEIPKETETPEEPEETDDPEETETPTPSETPETPDEPTPTPPQITPPPRPEGDDPEIVIVFDEDGTPLGAWVWDAEEEEWFFDEDIPLGALRTGDYGNLGRYAILSTLALGTMIVIVSARKKRKGSDAN